MEDTKKALESLFDEMLGNIKYFKKKSYHSLFESLYEGHKELFASIARMCEEAKEEDKEGLIEELASVIPEYAYLKMQEVPKRKKEMFSVDYNMAMAVYIIPLLTYSRDPECERIADRMVELWNKKQITSMKLGRSSFEDIAGGFRKGFCYITTAVCESQNKPDDCYELMMLRHYRDSYLMQTEEGKRIVEEYYEIAPRIVLAIGMQNDSSRIYEGIYRDYLTPCIHFAESGKNEECKKLYMDMVRHLQTKYLS